MSLSVLSLAVLRLNLGLNTEARVSRITVSWMMQGAPIKMENKQAQWLMSLVNLLQATFPISFGFYQRSPLVFKVSKSLKKVGDKRLS